MPISRIETDEPFTARQSNRRFPANKPAIAGERNWLIHSRTNNDPSAIVCFGRRFSVLYNLHLRRGQREAVGCAEREAGENKLRPSRHSRLQSCTRLLQPPKRQATSALLIVSPNSIFDLAARSTIGRSTARKLVVVSSRKNSCDGSPFHSRLAPHRSTNRCRPN